MNVSFFEKKKGKTQTNNIRGKTNTFERAWGSFSNYFKDLTESWPE